MSVWQTASLVIEVAQAVAQLAGFNKYKGKLEDFSNELTAWGDNNRTKYLEMRSHDPAFYAFYKSLPEYVKCESAVQRSKGAAFHGYRSKLTRALKTNRGYSPFAKVHLNNALASDAVAQSGLTRTVQSIKENKYVDNHILQQWAAIINAPVGIERFQTGSSSAIIQQSFTSLKSMGQGFNSAASAFGTTLYRVLDNDK